MRSSMLAAFLSIYLLRVVADGNDWVNPNFILQKTGMPNAQARIINFAKSTASSGPWTASGGTTVLPSNGDKRDYLSWAPYHWPDCNCCTAGRAHIATGGNRTDTSGTRNTTDTNTPGGSTYDDADGGEGNGAQDSNQVDGNDDDDITAVEPTEVQIPLPSLLPYFKQRMRRVRRLAYTKDAVAFISVNTHTPSLSKRVPQDFDDPDVLPVTVIIIPESGPITTTDYFADGSTGVQNAKTTSSARGKTSTQQVAATKTAGGSGLDCTPSPTKNLAPSASKSKYGATIKDALDFVLAKGPENEDESDIFPLITAVAAAYGDSNGKYTSYPRRKDPRYQASAYYFYSQPGALTNSSAAAKSKSEQVGFDLEQGTNNMVQSVQAPQQPTPTSLPLATPTIPFECPAAFATATQVQLDDGVWVTCDQLKHIYGYAEDTTGSVQHAGYV